MDTDQHPTTRNQKSAYWNKHISQWETSGLTQQKYCSQHGLALSTFGYWKRRSSKSTVDTIQFYPLLAPSSGPKAFPELTLSLQDGRFRIEIGPDFSTTTLKNLITTLEQL